MDVIDYGLYSKCLLCNKGYDKWKICKRET